VNKFRVDNPCEQCGATDAAYRFHAGDDAECTSSEGRSDPHIHRWCGSCGHEWLEPPPHIRKRDYPSWAATDQ